MNTQSQPTVVIVCGPNGAGKSTLAPALLASILQVPVYLNADSIAMGLGEIGGSNTAVGLLAGRLMLKRIRELMAARKSFAFETTLASRSFASWLSVARQQQGYRVELLFLALASEEQAIRRVLGRVAEGGHAVPEDIIRRRFIRGLKNFFQLYQPLVDRWQMIDASNDRAGLIAHHDREGSLVVSAADRWHELEADYGNG